MTDQRALMAARNNADWYAMMWDVHILRYTRDADRFRTIDPPMPFHGCVVAAKPDAPIRDMIAPLIGQRGFGVKDASGTHDLADVGLARMFEATWLWHAPYSVDDVADWEHIATPEALLRWEDAWCGTQPLDQRQFPDQTLKRGDVRIWGHQIDGGYDAGVIASVSADCVGVSNCFGTDARSAATALCAAFGQGKPLVGYEQGDDLTEALANGWQQIGPLAVWYRSKH
jgi:hypothetical protein